MTFRWTYVLIIVIVLEWILRFVMLFIVPRNRKPSSATAWLMLIMVEPVVGASIYAIFGSPQLPKYRRALQKKAEQHITDELNELSNIKNTSVQLKSNISIADKQFVKLNQVLGGFPIFEGNNVHFFDDYQLSLESLISDINSAKERILFEYFIIVLDSTSDPVIKALENAKARGVDVYVLFDALACKNYPNFKKLKSRLTSSGIKWNAMLGLKLRPGKEFTRPDLRNHRKIVVIDGNIGYTGSQNIVSKNYHRKDSLYYEELVARLEGPVVWQLSSVFRTDWYAETKKFLSSDKLPTAVGHVNAQVLPSGPGHSESTNLKLYTALIHGAKSKIVIVTPYFVPDDALMNAITSASQRGVEVTIINSESIDKILVGHAQRSYYEELLLAGVRIFLYKKPVFLHTKHVTIDDSIAVVGSSNFDIRSFELDLEVSLVLYDAGSVSKLREVEKRYIDNSNQINLKVWLKRPLRLKSLDSVARLTAALQ